MSKYNVFINDFSRGEVSPKTLGRVRDESYNRGSQLMQNCYPLKSGGFTKRSGFRFGLSLTAVDADYDGPAVIEFIATDNVGYFIVIDPACDAPNKVRAFDAEGTACGVTDFMVFQPPANLDPKGFVYSQVGDLIAITHTSGTMVPLFVLRATANTFVAYTILTGNPYVELTNINNLLKVPYRDRNVSAITITPSATTGTITLTASAAIFNSGMVSQTIFRIVHGATEGVARVTAFSSATAVTASVLIDFGADTASTNWAESSWSNYRGWPRTVISHQQRFIWGGNASQPDTLWGSLSGNLFLLMAKRLLQDASADTSGLGYFGDENPEIDPFVLTIAADVACSINWLGSSSVLKIGTLLKEFVGSGGDEILGGASVAFSPQTSEGSKAGRIVQVGDELIYIKVDGRGLRNLRYSENNGSNVSEDLSALSEHLATVGWDGVNVPAIGSLCFQRDEKHIWTVNSFGWLLTFTMDRETGVMGWARHKIKDSEGISSICVIPSPTKDSTRVWAAVKRTINGNTVWYLEYKGKEFDRPSIDPETIVTDEDLSVYLDCSKVITLGAASDTLTGLSHLEGEEVTVVKDGLLLGEFEVVGGEIDLGEEYPLGTVFVVGLYYEQDQIGVPLEAGGEFGPSQGMLSRIDSATVRLYRSLGVQIGACKFVNDAPDPETEIMYDIPDLADDEVNTGMFRMEPPNEFDYEQFVRIKSTGPYPLTVLGIALRGMAND